jgi:hypothetical protein
MTSLTLDQRRALDRMKEKLVPAAEAFLDASGVLAIKPKDFGHSQLRNLIAVANETSSPAVVKNFLRYQMGRDSRGFSWRFESGGTTLGDRLLGDFGTGGVIAEALQEIPDLDNPEKQQLASIEMIRQYLGFASRYLRYLDLQRR